MRDACHAVMNTNDRAVDNNKKTRTHEWLLGTTAELHNTTRTVLGLLHPVAPSEVLLLSDCVAWRSLAGHTGCHRSFAPLYCGRSVAVRRLVRAVS